jgi:diaminopropionate ammonia-lyase
MCEYSFNPFYKENPKWESNEFSFLKNNDMYDFHKSLPGYKPTPLVSLPGLAKSIGVKEIWVKDESHRFGVKSFKPLGASYAIFQFIKRIWESKYNSGFNAIDFTNKDFLTKVGSFTFCAATDGNHGKAVAWTAKKLNQKAVIYMPTNTVKSRIENIQNENAEVVFVEGTFDDCVTKCKEDAKKNNWCAISDTAYPGNMEIPGWILRGYSTIFREIEDAINTENRPQMDFVFLQAGVGSLAAAGASYYALRYGNKRPKLICVEPVSADCYLESIRFGNGHPLPSRGKLDSIMAGLNCGIPSLLAWPIVRDAMNLFLSISDDYAKMAMVKYQSSINGDQKIISGESGSAGLAGLLALCTDDHLKEAQLKIGIDHNSHILLINTEGDTDPENYKRVINNFNQLEG